MIFVWFRNFFRKKESKIEDKIELNYLCTNCGRKIKHEGRCLSCNLVEKRKREGQIKKELVPERKSPFKILIDNIEPNRELIIKEQEAKIPKVKEYDDKIKYIFNGITFIFCKEGYNLFEEKFKNSYYTIFIDDGYLARQHNITLFTEHFHRWIMDEEVERLAEELVSSKKDIHVHHKSGVYDKNGKYDNRLDNLEVLYKDNHAQRHGFDTWEEFQEWRTKNNEV